MNNMLMDPRRLTLGKWLIVAVAILAVVSMIVVVYHATKSPATPQIDPQFSRSKLHEKSKGKGPGGRSAEPAPRGDSTTEKRTVQAQDAARFASGSCLFDWRLDLKHAKICSLSPVLRGEGRGEGLLSSANCGPLTLTLSPEYSGEGTRTPCGS